MISSAVDEHRQEDIPVAGTFFLRRFAVGNEKEYFQILHRDAEARFFAYGWPGNVRELANVIERAVVLGQGPQVTGERSAVPESELWR